MTNPEHLQILKKGHKVWNEWSRENADFHQADLEGADLSGQYLGGVMLLGAYLSGANFSGATLPGANFLGATLFAADLSRADLVGAGFGSAWLHNADLSEANLWGANLEGAALMGANLKGANLEDANLNRANLYGAVLADTNLGNANLSRAYLGGADFTGARLAFTTFAGSDLSQVKGLEAVRHDGPSYLSIDTIYKSRGSIPEIFLRGCGVHDSLVAQLRAVGPAQFHTCFISFTERDDAFSEQLYLGLRAEGVRCWRWKEDAKWGRSLMRSIDEAVHAYDKLIVICSEQSLKAPAVIREIERALQKEDEQARQGREGEVLFPIRLDDYIFTGWSHHRKADVTAKHVGDFRKWKNHDSYRKSFDRLLRDLSYDAHQAEQ